MASSNHRLKTQHHDATRHTAYVTMMAQGYRTPAVPTIEFYDEDGRRHLVKLDERQVRIIAETATKVASQVSR